MSQYRGWKTRDNEWGEGLDMFQFADVVLELVCPQIYRGFPWCFWPLPAGQDSTQMPVGLSGRRASKNGCVQTGYCLPVSQPTGLHHHARMTPGLAGLSRVCLLPLMSFQFF